MYAIDINMFQRKYNITAKKSNISTYHVRVNINIYLNVRAKQQILIL